MLRGSERDKELQELFEKTRSLYTMIFEMEEKLFAISSIRIPLDHKTGKEYQEKLKNMTKIDLEYLIKFAEEHNLSHESVEKVIEKLKEYYNLS